MSLRAQISIRILIISLCILMLGGYISLSQARKAVDKEVDASIHLAIQLIKISLDSPKTNGTDWAFRLNRLNRLKQTRHLTIQIETATGEMINLSNQTESLQKTEKPPLWFTNLVVGNYKLVKYPLNKVNANMTLIIQANPMDEVAEVWQESQAFFSTLLLFVFLTCLSVHLVFNKTFSAIQSIIQHLKQIETNDYQKKLPAFPTREYNDIAVAINQMTRVLENSQQKNRALTQHSLEIQEEERRRLSQELHDEFSQSLTAIKVMAVALTRSQSNVEKISHSINDICNHLIAIVRSMMKQLHPLILIELGLKAALDDLLNHWEKHAVSTCFYLECDEAVDDLEKTMVIQIFRVIQEALTNIIRHANAHQVNITLKIKSNPKTLFLSIQDDGQGCHLEKVATGFGLLGMEERIKLLGGKFTLSSQPNQGMQIKAQILLS